MIYLCNAFSVNMLPALWVTEARTVHIERISAIEAGRILRECEWTSAFGHRFSAWHLARYLKVEIPVSRDSFKMTPEDVLIVAGVENRGQWHNEMKCPKWKFYRVQLEERNNDRLSGKDSL